MAIDITLLSTDLDVWAPGLRSVSAVLKAAGYSTRLVFMPINERYFSEKNLDDLASFTRHTDIIGVSCLAQGSAKARQVIEYLRSLKKLIIWGGVHASLNPAECSDWADIVCRGEGEEMMVELLERIGQGRDWKDIYNIAFKENGVIKLNDLRPPISDLDKLPLPDYAFDNEYHLTTEGLVQVSTLADIKHGGGIIFNSSRGCNLHCTYCCNVKLKNLYSGKNRYVRRMSVSKLIEHSLNLRKIFPQGKYFYFIDEDFGARPLEELEELSEEFPQKVGLPFECLTHPARITQQKMDLLVKAGLFRINMGIESGSERTKREIYDRHVSNEVVKKAVAIISGYPQVVPYYFLIIANPYEERSDLIATARLLSELPYGCHIIIYNMVFFPGSFLFERAIQDRLIEGEHDCGYELDFLGGLNYKNHPWKTKNLYLNGLIFLMGGSCVRYRIGILPRILIDALLNTRQIEYGENHTLVIKVMISIKFLVNSVRHTVGRWLKKYFGNPTLLYNFGYYLRRRFFIGNYHILITFGVTILDLPQVLGDFNLHGGGML